jgi:hypothetical protein
LRCSAVVAAAMPRRRGGGLRRVAAQQQADHLGLARREPVAAEAAQRALDAHVQLAGVVAGPHRRLRPELPVDRERGADEAFERAVGGDRLRVVGRMVVPAQDEQHQARLLRDGSQVGDVLRTAPAARILVVDVGAEVGVGVEPGRTALEEGAVIGIEQVSPAEIRVPSLDHLGGTSLLVVEQPGPAAATQHVEDGPLAGQALPEHGEQVRRELRAPDGLQHVGHRIQPGRSERVRHPIAQRGLVRRGISAWLRSSHASGFASVSIPAVWRRLATPPNRLDERLVRNALAEAHPPTDRRAAQQPWTRGGRARARPARGLEPRSEMA